MDERALDAQSAKSADMRDAAPHELHTLWLLDRLTTSAYRHKLARLGWRMAMDGSGRPIKMSNLGGGGSR